MTRETKRKSRLAGFVTVALAGGTLFGTCELRVHDAIVDGTKLFLLDLLDPSNFIITTDE